MYEVKAHAQLVMEDTSFCPNECCCARANCSDCGNVAKRSDKAMLSGSSSRISTNCNDCIFDTNAPGIGQKLFERRNGDATGGDFDVGVASTRDTRGSESVVAGVS